MRCLKKIKLVVVLFEKELRDSPTLEALKFQEQIYNNGIDVDVIIFDNSLNSMYMFDYFSNYPNEFKVRYYHTPDNKPLRDIYNEVIGGLEPDEIVVWLDDDTNLDSKYLNELVRVSNEYKHIDLFLPRIHVSKNLYSPYYSFLFFGRKITPQPVGVINSRHIGAINSGMAIRSNFFLLSGFKYPSIVDFYGTDKVFCDFFMSKNKELYILDLDFNHDVSFHPSNSSDENYLALLEKVDLFWRKYYGGYKVIQILYFLYIFCYCVREAVRRKKVAFIKLPFVRKKHE